MQFTTLSMALMATLAAAHVDHHQFHNKRYSVSNSTSTAPHTILTVYATEVYTITSCAASITNCPARSTGGVTTETIAVTTTYCPVSDADKARSQILSQYSHAKSVGSVYATPSMPLSTGAASDASPEGTTPPVSIPLSTGVPAASYGLPAASNVDAVGSNPVAAIPLSTGVSVPYGTGVVSVPAGTGSGASPSASGKTEVVVSNSTLTYTIGTGSSTTVVTTVIKHTSTETSYYTEYLTKTASAVPESTGGPTTTLTSTNHLTKTLTIAAVSSSTGANSGTGSDYDVSGNAAVVSAVTAASGSCVPVTVTETIAVSTVTVYGSMTSSGAKPVASTPASDESGSDAGAASSVPAVVVLSTATVVPVASSVPYYGNGTMASATKKKCSSVFPSGFITKTGGAAMPSGTGY